MTEPRLRELLVPFVQGVPGFELPDPVYTKLLAYLELLLRWNDRTNLTAIRDPEEIVTRHFGEGLFAAMQLQPLMHAGDTLLDVGSGAGFPGLPIQLALPDIHVTLAESQGKKASFLREAVRVLCLPAEVWAGRVESMPQGKRFHVVTLRAVDNMSVALAAATQRIASGGIFLEFASHGAVLAAGAAVLQARVGIPGSQSREVRLSRLVE